MKSRSNRPSGMQILFRELAVGCLIIAPYFLIAQGHP